MEWFKLPNDRKQIIINQTAIKLGLPGFAIEKDWWVTLALRAIFDLPIGLSFECVTKSGQAF